ncbi:type II toxin-antitoxin system RelB/DinJ family antitoxin [Selenomonas sp.]|uniref:type II toxin-antitoxin system RelB/DinJ family antitoxin n=1 Tax=Selenomonas sp. TaxID=2053611 RepID=UPI003FA2AFEA
MATVSAQIRLDPEVKARSMELFQSLGLDLSTAVNVFLRQCLIHRGLPFSVETHELPRLLHLSELSDTELEEEIEKGLADLADGKVRPAEEVFASIMEDNHAISG